ncbi:MAG: hypothetical protein ACTHWQ_02220 [Sphingobacterium sp.]
MSRKSMRYSCEGISGRFVWKRWDSSVSLNNVIHHLGADQLTLERTTAT